MGDEFTMRPVHLMEHKNPKDGVVTRCGKVLHHLATRANGWVTGWDSDATCPECERVAKGRAEMARNYNQRLSAIRSAQAMKGSQ